jgi:hypothetical protein
MPCISELAASEADRARLRETLTEVLAEFPRDTVMDSLEPLDAEPEWPGRSYPSERVPSKRIMRWRAACATSTAPEREKLIALLRAGRKYSHMWHQANVGSALNPIRDELFAALHALDGVAS